MQHVSVSHFRNGKIAEDFANLSWDGGKFSSKLGHYCNNSILCLGERYHLGSSMYDAIMGREGGFGARKKYIKGNFRNLGPILTCFGQFQPKGISYRYI